MKTPIHRKIPTSRILSPCRALPLILALVTVVAQAQKTDGADQNAEQIAQEAREAAQTEPRKKITGRKAWFMCTEIPKDLQNPVSVLVEENIHQVTLSIRNMSDPFPVRGEGMVKIVKEVPNPEKSDSPLYQTLVQTKIPDHIQNALIILVPAPKNSSQNLVFGSKVLDLNDFKGGDYLYLNLSPVDVGITLGENRAVLKPGEMKIQTNQEIKAATNKVLSLHYHPTEEDRWKLIVATTVVVQPTRREICVFHWDQQTNRMDYRGATFPVELEEPAP